MWLCLFLSLPTCELLKNLETACDFGSLFKSTCLSMSKGQPIHPYSLDMLLQLSKWPTPILVTPGHPPPGNPWPLHPGNPWPPPSR